MIFCSQDFGLYLNLLNYHFINLKISVFIHLYENVQSDNGWSTFRFNMKQVFRLSLTSDSEKLLSFWVHASFFIRIKNDRGITTVEDLVRSKLTVKQAVQITYQLISCVRFLHYCGLTHGQLTDDSVVVVYNENVSITYMHHHFKLFQNEIMNYNASTNY